MGLFDIIILAGLVAGGSYGLKNGFIKTATIFLGTLLCFVLAFLFKNVLANFLSYNLPFFNFNGLTSLNIVLYQFIAFTVLLAIFAIILAVVIRLAGGIEKILNITVVLGIPSKIFGFVLGVLEALVITFILLFIIKGTVINKEIKLIDNSKMAPVILENMPGLSNIAKNTNESLNDVVSICKNYDSKNADQFNKQVEDTLLKHKIIDNNYLNKLRKKGKIK